MVFSKARGEHRSVHRLRYHVSAVGWHPIHIGVRRGLDPPRKPPGDYGDTVGYESGYNVGYLSRPQYAR